MPGQASNALRTVSRITAFTLGSGRPGTSLHSWRMTCGVTRACLGPLDENFSACPLPVR